MQRSTFLSADSVQAPSWVAASATWFGEFALTRMTTATPGSNFAGCEYSHLLCGLSALPCTKAEPILILHWDFKTSCAAEWHAVLDQFWTLCRPEHALPLLSSTLLSSSVSNNSSQPSRRKTWGMYLYFYTVFLCPVDCAILVFALWIFFCGSN